MRTREDRLEYQRKYQREKYALMKQMGVPRMTPEEKLVWNEQRRKKYREDPEYRAKVKEQNNRRWQRIRERVKQAKQD